MNDLEQLIHGAIDGKLSDAEFLTLEEILLTDTEAREEYQKLVWLSSALDVKHAGVVTTSTVPIEKVIQFQNRRTLRTSLLAAAAIVLITLVSMSLFFVDKPASSLAFETSPGSVFTLTHAEKENVPTGATLLTGSRLQLEQGVVELTFDSGVKSIIYAPADLTLHKADQLFLNRGSAWFDVPQDAVGFTVKTNELNVVDLGTQFGVYSNKNDYDEVHVFKGSVEASSLRKEGTTITLTAGQARRLNTVGDLIDITPEKKSYLTSLPNTLPHVHWSFDTDFQASGTHPAAENIHSNAIAQPQRVLGKVGSALSLDGQQQYIETDWPGFSGNRPRTAAFWIKIPAGANFTGHPRGIVAWGDNYNTNSKWKIGLSSASKDKAPHLRVSWGFYWLTSKEALEPDTWHHVIVTTTGQVDTQNRPEAKLYLNGQLAQSTPRPVGAQILPDPDTKTLTRNASPLVIGNDLRVRAKKTPMQGVIDELYIFDGHMRPEDVQQWLPSAITN